MVIPGHIVVALAGIVVTGGVVAASTITDEPSRVPATTTVVTRVIDGDTVEIASGQRVRLIGIDTPERGKCGFKSASEAMRRMVEGRKVTLVNPSSVQDLDAYQRLLRFVEVGDQDAGYAQILTGRATARFDSRDGYDSHPREAKYRQADHRHQGACERKQDLRQQRHQQREEQWRTARRVGRKADIRIRDGESASQVLHRARAVLSKRRHLHDLAQQAPPQPAPAPVPTPAPPPPAPAPPSSAFVPPAGWTTDALTPGYTGCRQGYPGGRINGVYVWKPIDC